MADVAIHYIKDGPPTIDYMYIHDNPKPGDYASYQHVGKDTQISKQEIASVKDDVTVVHRHDIYDGLIKTSLSDILFKYHVKKDGKIIRYTVEKRGDEVHPLGIAKAGTGNYKKVVFKKLPKPEIIHTRGGTFYITHMMGYTYTVSSLGVDITVIDLIDKNVKFGIVKSTAEVSSKLDLNDMGNYISNNINMLDLKSPAPFVNYFTSKIALIAPSMYKQEFELIETN